MALNSLPAESINAAQLQPLQLLNSCPALRTAPLLCVAFSGGLDSTVLLHLLLRLRDSGELHGSLRAIHVNHGLQAIASQWGQHCRQICEQYGVPCTVVDVTVAQHQRESPEAAARSARYAAFAQHLQPGELLVQAHHQDDQAETLLLRLLRGSGVRGLGGIPAERELGNATLVRPLLKVSRAALMQYANAQQLQWVEDPSNSDERFDRNFLRNTLLPTLRQRWPQASASLARSAQLEQEAAGLLDELALLDWQRARLDFPNRLKLSALQSLSQPRARNLLGHWLTHQPDTLHIGSAPQYALLQRCIDELVLPADQDYRMLRWGDGEQARCLHRYRDALYLLRPLASTPVDMTWSGREPLLLQEPLGSLSWHSSAQQREPDDLIVKFRQGGEVFPMPSGQHKTLKNFLQERGIPPWLRDHIPLLYRGDTLLAIGDILLPGIVLDESGETHNPLCWERSELLCGY